MIDEPIPNVFSSKSVGVRVAFAHLNTKHNISVGFPGLATSWRVSLVTPPWCKNTPVASGHREKREKKGETKGKMERGRAGGH